MIADAHHDLLHDLMFRASEPAAFKTHWLPPLRAGQVGVQVCAMACEERVYPGPGIVQVLRQAAAFHRACRENPTEVVHVQRRADLDAALESGRVGMVLALEGVDAIGRHLDIADVLVDLGVRMVGMTWQFQNDAADGAGEPGRGGLSTFGRELATRLLGRGVTLDVAHASSRTFDDVVELAGAEGGAVLCSHGGCRSLHDHPRNLADDQLRALADAGGLTCIAAVPPMLSVDRRDLGLMVEHIVHAVGIMGPDRVGLGGDFFGQLMRSLPGLVSGMSAVSGPSSAEPQLPPTMEGLEGSEDYASLGPALMDAGLTPEQVDGVLHGNLIRFLKSNLPDG